MLKQPKESSMGNHVSSHNVSIRVLHLLLCCHFEGLLISFSSIQHAQSAITFQANCTLLSYPSWFTIFLCCAQIFFCNVTLPINCIRSWIITRIPTEFSSSETCRINEFPPLPLRQCNNTQNVPWQYMQLHKYIIKSVSLPLETVRAGDHCDLKISRQILPLLFMFG